MTDTAFTEALGEEHPDGMLDFSLIPSGCLPVAAGAAASSLQIIRKTRLSLAKEDS